MLGIVAALILASKADSLRDRCDRCPCYPPVGTGSPRGSAKSMRSGAPYERLIRVGREAES